MNKFNHLCTPEGEKLKNAPEGFIPWQEYPRPSLKRDSFFCLNGVWDFETSKGGQAPKEYTRKILVPFSPESVLSGINETFEKGELLFYKKTFVLPESFVKSKVILHFGAVDQIAKVYLNGTFLGEHVGGYEHFSFDITDAVISHGENVLEVTVQDDLDLSLPYGKQSKKRGGMWYTTTSGIWQTVWLESVPERFIEALDIKTDRLGATVTVTGVCAGKAILFAEAGEIENEFELKDGTVHITPKVIKLWSPERPHIYRFKIVAGDDEITSYFALRFLKTINVNGINRLCLNGEPYFFNGVLDQGYYSDGILTPASPQCFKDDILAMKALGFNTLRKHIKVEPELFYYYCDVLGMVVFQDFVNNDTYSFIRDTALPTVGLQRINDNFLHRNKLSRLRFEKGMLSTFNTLKNHPCICYWTIFNEGWGQFQASKMYKTLKSLDSTRFIDSASGWFYCADSDVESLHIYFKPLSIKNAKKRSTKPIVISEYGGYALSVRNHVFNESNEYGYSKFTDAPQLNCAVEALFENQLLPLIEQGLCGAIYTQLSDVEDETNGFLTYDRKINKAQGSRISEINARMNREIKKQ